MSVAAVEPRDYLELLQSLIGFATVSRDPNRELLAYVEEWLSRHGVKSEILWNEDGRKGNLWATIGPADRPGAILSGHTDVVPVDGQASAVGAARLIHVDDFAKSR